MRIKLTALAILWLIVPCLSKSALASQGSLKASLDEVIAGFDSEGVETAIVIEDLKSSGTVLSQNADKLMNPASNMKVLTTYAALSHWGSNFRFKTQALADGEVRQGTLPHLILKGYGDPTFSSEQLASLAQQLKKQGIQKIDRVTLDDSYFKVSDFPGRFKSRQRDAPFNATVGALSIDNNILNLEVEPAEKVGAAASIHLLPELNGFPIEGTVLTKGKGARVIVRNPADPEALNIEVDGNIAPKSEAKRYRIAYPHPTKIAGWRLLQDLSAAGIAVPEKFDLGICPQGGKVIAEEQSPPLIEILAEINKESNNFMAEQLTIGLGTVLGVPGDTQKGIQVIQNVLTSLGLNLKGLLMENGSGLSQNTRIRAKTLVDVLHQAWQNPKRRDEFLSSLSILGVDGTLKRRYRGSNIEGFFLGKTGTLNGVTALSGYVFRRSAPKEPPYLFAFIANGKGKNFWKMKELQGKLLETLINQ